MAEGAALTRPPLPEPGEGVDGPDRGDGHGNPRVLFLSAASGLAEDWCWVAQTADRFDVVHWRGGVDGMTVDQCRRLVGALQAAGKPMLVTVTAGEAPAEGRGAYAVLLSAAAALLASDWDTAEAVWLEWGRSCVVLPGAGQGDGVTDQLYRWLLGRRPRGTDGGTLPPEAEAPTS